MHINLLSVIKYHTTSQSTLKSVKSSLNLKFSSYNLEIILLPIILLL